MLLMVSNVYALSLDKNLSLSVKNQQFSYKTKTKSTNPDKVVVFISYKTNPNYLDIVETTLDVSEIANGHVFFERPNGSSKKRVIDSCKSEHGITVIPGNTRIQVNSIKMPSRVTCYGDSGNYREAYSTFQSGN